MPMVPMSTSDPVLVACVCLHAVQLRAEFEAVTGVTKRLTSEWPSYKSWILQLASSRSSLEACVASVDDDLDEGKIAFNRLLSENLIQLPAIT